MKQAVQSIAFLQANWAKKLFTLAMSKLGTGPQNSAAVAIQVRRAIAQVLPADGLHDNEIERVELVLGFLLEQDEFQRSDLLLASLLRLEHETGADLLQSLDGKVDAEGYIRIRQALGVIALAWQYYAHPTDVILTVDDYRQRLNLN